MTTIPGASRYLNASTLANVRGQSPSLPTVLGDGGMGGAGILDLAYRPNNGIGLSARARAIAASTIRNSNELLNQLLSLGTSEMSTMQSMQQKILALRANIPQSQLSREIRGETLDTQVTDTAAANTGSINQTV